MTRKLSPDERARIAAAIRMVGPGEIGRRLGGLSTEATLRLAGDFGSHPATETHAAEHLSALDDIIEAAETGASASPMASASKGR
jgi:hypothetical protein